MRTWVFAYSQDHWKFQSPAPHTRSTLRSCTYRTCPPPFQLLWKAWTSSAVAHPSKVKVSTLHPACKRYVISSAPLALASLFVGYLAPMDDSIAGSEASHDLVHPYSLHWSSTSRHQGQWDHPAEAWASFNMWRVVHPLTMLSKHSVQSSRWTRVAAVGVRRSIYSVRGLLKNVNEDLVALTSWINVRARHDGLCC